MDGDQEEGGGHRPRRQAALRVQTASALSLYQSPDLNEDEALQVALFASLESIPEADLSDGSLQSHPPNRPSTSARGGPPSRGRGSASTSSRRSSGATAAAINEDSSSGEEDDDIKMAKGDRQVNSGDSGHRPKGKPGPKPKGDGKQNGKMSANGSNQQHQVNGNTKPQVSATGQRFRTLEEKRNGVGKRQDDDRKPIHQRAARKFASNSPGSTKTTVDNDLFRVPKDERTRLEKEAKNFSLFPDVAIHAKDFINFMRVTPLDMILKKQLVVPFARSMPLEDFEKKFKADQALERAEEEERARAAEAGLAGGSKKDADENGTRTEEQQSSSKGRGRPRRSSGRKEAQEDEQDEEEEENEDEEVHSDDEEDQDQVDSEQESEEASDDASDSDADDRPASRPPTTIRRRKKRARIVLPDRRPPKRSSTARSPVSTRVQGANKKPKPIANGYQDYAKTEQKRPHRHSKPTSLYDVHLLSDEDRQMERAIYESQQAGPSGLNLQSPQNGNGHSSTAGSSATSSSFSNRAARKTTASNAGGSPKKRSDRDQVHRSANEKYALKRDKLAEAEKRFEKSLNGDDSSDEEAQPRAADNSEYDSDAMLLREDDVVTISDSDSSSSSSSDNQPRRRVTNQAEVVELDGDEIDDVLLNKLRSINLERKKAKQKNAATAGVRAPNTFDHVRTRSSDRKTRNSKQLHQQKIQETLTGHGQFDGTHASSSSAASSAPSANGQQQQRAAAADAASPTSGHTGTPGTGTH